MGEFLVLHLSELTKLSNGEIAQVEDPTVLHLSELTKLSNMFESFPNTNLFYIFLN